MKQISYIVSYACAFLSLCSVGGEIYAPKDGEWNGSYSGTMTFWVEEGNPPEVTEKSFTVGQDGKLSGDDWETLTSGMSGEMKVACAAAQSAAEAHVAIKNMSDNLQEAIVDIGVNSETGNLTYKKLGESKKSGANPTEVVLPKYTVAKYTEDGVNYLSLFKDSKQEGALWTYGIIPDNKSMDQFTVGKNTFSEISGWKNTDAKTDTSVKDILLSSGSDFATKNWQVVVRSTKNGALYYVPFSNALSDGKSLSVSKTDGTSNGSMSIKGFENASTDDIPYKKSNGELGWKAGGGSSNIDMKSINTNDASSIDGTIALNGFQSAINASTQGTGNQFQIPYAKASSAAESDALTWGNPMTFLDGSFFKTMTKEGSEGKVTLNVTVEQDKDELLVVHGGEGGSTTLEKVEIDNKTIIKDSAKLKVNTKDKGGLVADEPGEGETASAGLYVKTDDSSIKKGTDDGALSVVLADKKGLAKEESGETSSGGLYVNIGDGLEYDNDGKIKTTAFRELDGISISTNESSSVDGKVAIYGFASADEGAGEGDDTYKIPYSCGLGYVYWSNPLEFFSDNFFKLSTAEPGKITLNVDTTSDEDKIAIIHGGTDPSLTTKTLDGKSLEVGGSGSNAKLQIKNFATATKSGNITQLLTDPQASTARQRYSFLAKDANTDGGSLVYLGIDNTIGNFIIPKPDAHSIEYTQSTSGGETNLSIKGAMDDNSNGKILFGAGKDADVVWAKPNEGSFDYDPDVKDFEIYGMTAGVSEPGIDVTGALTNADDNAAFSDTYKFMVRYDDGGEDGAKVGYMDIGGILDMSSSSSNRVDGKSIVRNKDNEDKLEVNGFQGATEGYIPYKNDGEIKWKELSLGAFVDGITLTTNTANGAVESGKASIYGFSTASDGQVPYKDGNTLKWKVAGGGSDVDDVSITTNTANGAVESGKASIYGFRDAENGYVAFKNGDTIGWTNLQAASAISLDNMSVSSNESEQVQMFGFDEADDFNFPYKDELGYVAWAAFDDDSISLDDEDGEVKIVGFESASENQIPYKKAKDGGGYELGWTNVVLQAGALSINGAAGTNFVFEAGENSNVTFTPSLGSDGAVHIKVNIKWAD